MPPGSNRPRLVDMVSFPTNRLPRQFDWCDHPVARDPILPIQRQSRHRSKTFCWTTVVAAVVVIMFGTLFLHLAVAVVRSMSDEEAKCCGL